MVVVITVIEKINHEENERIASAVLMRAVAVSIADDLFVNGNGDKAIRLVLEIRDKKNGGGWCKAAVIDLIERKLNALNASLRRNSRIQADG